MQDPTPLNNPELDALARQLTAARPLLGVADRDALLYQCAFAAGRQSALRGVRRWSVAAACLMVMAGGIGLMSMARREPRQPGPAVIVHQPTMPTNSVRPTTPQEDSFRSSSLFAGASWPQILASLESRSVVQPISAAEVEPDRPMLRARTFLIDPDYLH